MQCTPTECPKCGTELVRNPKGGRPTRWCSEGCRRSGESEMARLESLLRVFHRGSLRRQDQRATRPLRDDAIADMQRRFDHLAGVPVTGAVVL